MWKLTIHQDMFSQCSSTRPSPILLRSLTRHRTLCSNPRSWLFFTNYWQFHYVDSIVSPCNYSSWNARGRCTHAHKIVFAGACVRAHGRYMVWAVCTYVCAWGKQRLVMWSRLCLPFLLVFVLADSCNGDGTRAAITLCIYWGIDAICTHHTERTQVTVTVGSSNATTDVASTVTIYVTEMTTVTMGKTKVTAQYTVTSGS